MNISPEEVHEEWIDQYAVNQIRTIADHYGIFEHLFGDAYFHPIVNLNIDFTHNELKIPVHKGNIIKPEEVVAFFFLSATPRKWDRRCV